MTRESSNRPSRARIVVLGAVMLVAVAASIATSPPSASDAETAEVELDAKTTKIVRDIELDLHLEGAFDGEMINFSCGQAWVENAGRHKVRVTVEELDPAGAEPHTMEVLSDIGTKYDDGSITEGPRALVSLPLPCQNDGECSARYRFTCELPEPPTEGSVKLEWRASSHIRYDPGGFCGSGESSLDVRSKDVSG